MIHIIFTRTAKKISIAAVLTLIIFQLISCAKDEVPRPAPPATTPRPATPVTPTSNTSTNTYTHKIVWVYEHSYISDKSDSTTLKAHYLYLSNIKSYRWRKVDGPPSYKITDSTSSATTVTDLETGVYKFEIFVEEVSGTTDSDTLFVYVIKPGVSEVIFPKMQWSCPMGCGTYSIQNIYSFIPRNKPLKVFLKYENSSVWKEIIHQSQWSGGDEYIWGISDEEYFGLYANYPENEMERFDVKIQY